MIFSVEFRQELAQVLSFNSTMNLKRSHVLFAEHGGRGAFVKIDLALLHTVANPYPGKFFHASQRAVT